MTAPEGRAEPVVIVITGPIASGKSTIARLVAAELEHAHVRTAVIDLDEVHHALVADGQSSADDAWALARREAARQATSYLDDGVAVVIAEGSFNAPRDRANFADGVGVDVQPIYATLQVSYQEALRRAQQDPTRGRSRDPAFLRPYFDAAEAQARPPDFELVIDTERQSATAAAATIAGRVRSATFDAGPRVG